ncbi:hypothetical protein NP233_g7112 [Leucocoprinus birnbaumii]|uniref:Uncharacterized protein n=1 Tax=Leucocoprinus birnbaumii TaxID=56174 RepID=A0AAD5YV24_9AGAR|nr:hypothetical protein NP233_g7112 [Leucocoprinus birnbaumii]
MVNGLVFLGASIVIAVLFGISQRQASSVPSSAFVIGCALRDKGTQTTQFLGLAFVALVSGYIIGLTVLMTIGYLQARKSNVPREVPASLLLDGLVPDLLLLAVDLGTLAAALFNGKHRIWMIRVQNSVHVIIASRVILQTKLRMQKNASGAIGGMMSMTVSAPIRFNSLSPWDSTKSESDSSETQSV